MFNKIMTISLLIFTAVIVHQGSIVIGDIATISVSTSNAAVK